MACQIYRPYPGVALVATPWGSVLLGAPSDAFKATQQFCQREDIAFPRVLVAPPLLLAAATPQFTPEFFLYDLLFVQGAAFRAELAGTRLTLVVRPGQVEAVKKALRMTLLGPTATELRAYAQQAPQCGLDSATIAFLDSQSASMAPKRGDQPSTVDDFIDVQVFDADGWVNLFDSQLAIGQSPQQTLRIRQGTQETEVDLRSQTTVVPFATLPPPQAPTLPETFAVKMLGTRSGFDLSGPTTGFLIWVNGRAVLYDGPPGSRYMFEQQGIDPADIDGIILSHCHEDHMGSFVEMVLAGRRPRVYTAEPIYRSALAKLACYFETTEAEAETYIDYVRVVPGEPLALLGATFHFFYTVHAIPTLGVQVCLERDGVAYGCQISGDTLDHHGLDKLHETGVLDAATHRRMRQLIPDTRQPHHLYFADVGEALIHGHPADWADNPNAVVYYHCSHNPRTTSFGHPVANAGDLHVLVPRTHYHNITPARLVRALGFLPLTDPTWLTLLLHSGHSRAYATGEKLVPNHHQLSLVVAGRLRQAEASRADTSAAGHSVDELCAGDLFGYLTEAQGLCTQPQLALMPTEVFHLDAELVRQYARQSQNEPVLTQVCGLRPLMDAHFLLRLVDANIRNGLCHCASVGAVEAGSRVEAKSGERVLYLITAGEVAIDVAGERKLATPRRLTHTDPWAFVGETDVLPGLTTLTWSARAITKVQYLKLPAPEVQQLCRSSAAVLYTLQAAARARR